MGLGRVTILLIALAGMQAGMLHAQDVQQPLQAQQEDIRPCLPAPNLPNTCRGSAAVNDFLHEVNGCLQQSKSVKMKVGEIGRSQRGVPILMVTITDAARSPGFGGLMIIARQHGNEPAGTRAALELIRLFAVDDKNMSTTLGSLTIRIVPIANPDGMDLFQRRTANGRDMNRDWSTRQLPETKAITQAIEIARPQILMDLHELTPGDGNRPFVLGIPGSKSSHLLSAVKANFIENGLPVSTRASERYSTTGLLHRHFVSKYEGVGFLVESKYTGDPAENLKARSEYHLHAVTAVMKQISQNQVH